MFGVIGARNTLHTGYRKVTTAGAAIFDCDGLVLSASEKKFFGDADPWGFILFAKNIADVEQVRRLTGDLRDSVGRNAPILVDQEGGRVARLRPPLWFDWLPPLEQQSQVAPVNRSRAMWIRYRLIADELSRLGVDVNCAPMADVPQANVHAIIRDRCYGTKVDTIIDAAQAVADGLLAGGVLPVLKHIPGHGRPTADSHAELPQTGAGRGELDAVDFATFAALKDLPMGMTAHVVYSSIDPDNCATLSKTMINLIRNDIGFDGLLMTDDIYMSALKGSYGTRAKAALAAGCDVVLHCNSSLPERMEVAAAAGNLGEKASKRAEKALSLRQAPVEVDKSELLAELNRLLMVGADG